MEKYATFADFFQVQKILNEENISSEKIIDQLKIDLNEKQIKLLLTAGVKHCFDQVSSNDSIIYDIHQSLRKIYNVDNTNDSSSNKNKRIKTIFNNQFKKKEENDGSYCYKVLNIRQLKCLIFRYLDSVSLKKCTNVSSDWLVDVNHVTSQSTFTSTDFIPYKSGRIHYQQKSSNITGFRWSECAEINPWSFKFNTLFCNLVHFNKIRRLTLHSTSIKTYENIEEYTRVISTLLRNNCNNINYLNIGVPLFDAKNNNYNIKFPNLQSLTMTRSYNYIEFGSHLVNLYMHDYIIDFSLWDHLARSCNLSNVESMEFRDVDVKNNQISIIKDKLIPTIAKKLTKLRNFKWFSNKSVYGVKLSFISHISKHAKYLHSLELNIVNTAEFNQNHDFEFESIENVYILMDKDVKLKPLVTNQLCNMLTTSTKCITDAITQDAQNQNFGVNDAIQSIDPDDINYNNDEDTAVNQNPQIATDSNRNMKQSNNSCVNDQKLVCTSLKFWSCDKRLGLYCKGIHFQKILQKINDTCDTSKLTKLTFYTGVEIDDDHAVIALLEQIKKLKSIKEMEMEGQCVICDYYGDWDKTAKDWSNRKFLNTLCTTMQSIYSLTNVIDKVDIQVNTIVKHKHFGLFDEPVLYQSTNNWQGPTEIHEHIQISKEWLPKITKVIKSFLESRKEAIKKREPVEITSRHTFSGTGSFDNVSIDLIIRDSQDHATINTITTCTKN